MVRKLLVGIDGSESGRKALQFARGLAEALQAKVTVMHVTEPPDVAPFVGYGLSIAQYQDHQREQARMLMDRVLREMAPLPVEEVISVGNPADAICEEAERGDYDLVVVGSRGLGAAGRWLLGSVSDRITHHCKRPVTVVH